MIGELTVVAVVVLTALALSTLGGLLGGFFGRRANEREMRLQVDQFKIEADASLDRMRRHGRARGWTR